MGPVWEANHVWLIFVITVLWTGYSEVFGSIASTLSIPFFVAAIGIILRGGAYALRSGTRAGTGAAKGRDRAVAVVDPHAVRAGADRRRHRRGPGAGRKRRRRPRDELAQPARDHVGLIAVAFSAYLAAVFLAADAVRHDDPEMEEAFRTRALISGVIAGLVAAAAA